MLRQNGLVPLFANKERSKDSFLNRKKLCKSQRVAPHYPTEEMKRLKCYNTMMMDGTDKGVNVLKYAAKKQGRGKDIEMNRMLLIVETFTSSCWQRYGHDDRWSWCADHGHGDRGSGGYHGGP